MYNYCTLFKFLTINTNGWKRCTTLTLISSLFFCFINQAAAQRPAWQFVDLLSNKEGGGNHPSITKDNRGGLHISCWSESQNQLLYAWRSTNDYTWQFQKVAPDKNGGYKSVIKTDSNGIPHIVWFADLGGQMQLCYSYLVGNNWITEVVSERTWGGYGPRFALSEGYIQASLDFVLNEDGSPFIVFFDGTFKDCNQDPSAFGFEMKRAIKRNGAWVVEDFGDIPAYGNTYLVNLCEGKAGARYGEFCTIIQNPITKQKSVFTVGNVNGEIYRFDEPQSANERWFRTIIDSTIRITGNTLNMGLYAQLKELYFEGLSAGITPNGTIHLAYNLSYYYGRNNFSVINGRYYPVMTHTRIAADTTIHQTIAPTIETRKGQFLNNSALYCLNDSVVFISYADRDGGFQILQFSADSGKTWRADTVGIVTAPRAAAPIHVLGDSVHIFFYHNTAESLIHGKRLWQVHPDSTIPTWQFDTLNTTQRWGALYDATITTIGQDTVLHLAFTDDRRTQLYYGTWDFKSSFEWEVVGKGRYRELALAISSSGIPQLVYSDNAALSYTRKTNNSWQTRTGLGPVTSFLQAKPTWFGDSVHVVWFEPNSGLKYLRFERGQPAVLAPTEEEIALLAGDYVSLAVDSSGTPHVAYRESNTGRLLYAKRSNMRTWLVEAADTTRVPNNQSPNLYLAILNNGQNLAAIAHRNSNNNALYYSQQISPGTWQRDSLPLRDVVRLGVPLVLAFDSASVPYIAYNISSTTTAEVQILRKPHNDTTWRAVPIVENEGKIADRFQFFINGKRLTLAGVRTLEGAGGLAVLTANEWKAGTPSSRPLSSGTENLNKLSLYPNPIQDKFSLDFTLNEPDKLTIMLTEPTGRIVEQLFEASLPAGQHRFHFDAGNLAAGMYFCNIITSTKSKVIKTIKTP